MIDILTEQSGLMKFVNPVSALRNKLQLIIEKELVKVIFSIEYYLAFACLTRERDPTSLRVLKTFWKVIAGSKQKRREMSQLLLIEDSQMQNRFQINFSFLPQCPFSHEDIKTIDKELQREMRDI